MHNSPLHLKLYFQRAYAETARIIGYGGCTLAEFWEKAKQTGIPDHQMRNAVYDMTRYDKREGPEPRYELRDDVKNLCWQLLGPAPDHPLHGRLRDGPALGTEAEERKWRERLEKEKAGEEGEDQPELSRKRRARGEGK